MPQSNFVATKNDQLPCHNGPKASYGWCDFSTAQSFTFDYSQAIAQNVVEDVQAIYFDNSQNNSPVTLVCDQSQQTIVFGTGAQGYVPLLLSQSAKFTVTSGGTGKFSFQALNFPIPAAMWSQNAAQFNSAGALLVSDTALDGAIAAGYLQSQNYQLGNSGLIVPRLAGSMQFAGSLSGAATSLTLIPAQAGSAYFLTRLGARLSANAKLASAGNLAVTISDGANFNAVLHPYLPATVAGAGDSTIMDEDLQYISHAQNAALTVTMSAALTAGYLDLVAYGGYTSLTGA